MKREEFFSAGGYYPFIVQSNSLMHKEAIALGKIAVKNWLANHPNIRTVRWLDLACGGMPISSIEIIAEFPEIDFNYTGIDINPDQVVQANTEAEFPDNVSSKLIIEGNAWELDNVDGSFDIVFSGMNFHHGTGPELFSVAKQLQKLLKPEGIIFSHDEYRPSHEEYILRPSFNPQDESESFMLIDQTKLSSIPGFEMGSKKFDPQQDDWRTKFIAAISEFLRLAGGKEEFVDQTSEHIYTRDFAVSVPEIRSIFEIAGFLSSELVPTSEHILSDFFGFLVFERS